MSGSFQPGAEPCFTRNEPPVFNMVVGFIILGAALVAYTPQVLKMWQMRSNEGLSALAIIFANFSNAATMFNAINTAWDKLMCCRIVSFWHCSILLLSFYQMCIIFIAWFIMYYSLIEIFAALLVPENLKYVSYLALYPPVKAPREYLEQQTHKRIVTAFFWTFYFVFLIGGTVVVFSWNFFYNRTDKLYRTTDLVFSIIAAVTQAMIWIPQIYTTFTKKDPGALSLVMLSITTPGSAVTIYNLIAFKNPVQVWLPFAIAGTAQLTLLTMCIIFTCRKRYQTEASPDTTPPPSDGSSYFSRLSSVVNESENESLLGKEDK